MRIEMGTRENWWKFPRRVVCFLVIETQFLSYLLEPHDYISFANAINYNSMQNGSKLITTLYSQLVRNG